MSNETIFVSVASYRDSSCSKTIQSMLTNAAYPERIFIGICQQNKEGNSEEICHPLGNTNNIRIINLDYSDAKGPTWARYLCSTLYHNEDYFLQIDSHVLFVKDWDVKCINMVKQIKTIYGGKPILSHYTKSDDDYNKENKDNTVTRMCQSFFNKRGMVSFLGSEAISVKKDEYFVNPYVAGGFIFAEGSFVLDVPFDPYLDYIFVGEEILLSARAYTNGYDVYAPSEDIVFHYYTRKDEPKIWTDNPYYQDNEPHEDIRKLLKLTSGSSKVKARYGLGNVRSLEDFYEFSGIDIYNKRVTKNFCHAELDPYSEVQITEEVKECIKSSTASVFGTVIFIVLIIFAFRIFCLKGSLRK